MLLKVSMYILASVSLQQSPFSPGVGGFLPAVKQIGNVAALPGIVGVRLLTTKIF